VTKHRLEKGFTLIELLVVIAILGILAGLLIPALAYGKFRAHVTTCTNNYRQLALAAAMYAGEDSKGRLPSFTVPSSKLMGFRNLYPWIIAVPTFKAMETHGITQPQIWFCPLHEKWRLALEMFQWKFGRPLATIDDLDKYYVETQQGNYAGVDMNWWVPRSLERFPNLTYPDASLPTSRLKTPWPSKMDDLTISTRPIVSDWTDGDKETSGDSFSRAWGGHTFAGKLRNANSGYADGHVEPHSAKRMKWELKLINGDDSYIFY
jgi:prepilin-type N-terminal cleavage/methylation domain-containing protein/prepilin-type processing-associated H-X9-DG protein